MPISCPGSQTLTSTQTRSALAVSPFAASGAAEARAREAAIADLNAQAAATACSPGCTRSIGTPAARVARRSFRRIWYLLFVAIRYEVTVTATMIVACVPTPLPRPGRRGDVPDVPDRGADDFFNASGVVDIDLPQPAIDRLECGQVTVFTVTTVAVDAPCKGYHFDMLYHEAIRNMDERVAGLQCAPGCPDRHYYLIAQTGACADDIARVTLTVGVVCLGEDAPRDFGLDLRSGDELRAPFSDRLPGASPAPVENISIELRPNDATWDCPNELRYWITLRASVGDCASALDFQPYLSRAESQAAAIWRGMRCSPPCEKQPLQETGAEWGCENGVVTVRYVFRVACEKPE